VLSHGGYRRHQVRLPGAVVADHQEAAIVLGLLELQLGKDDAGELVRHLIGDYVGPDQLPRLVLLVSCAKLHDRLDRVELDKVSVLHTSVLSSEASLCEPH